MQEPDTLTIGRSDRPPRARLRFVAAAVVAAGLALAVHTVAVGSDPRGTSPAVPAYGGGAEPRPLEAGSYELRIGRAGSATATVTIPGGWVGWQGGAWFADEASFAGVVVLEVSAVAGRPCPQSPEEMHAVHGRRSLLSALRHLPRHTVVHEPVRDDRFSGSATYLRLVAGHARCPGDRPFALFDAESTGMVPSAGPGTTLELWVLEREPRPVLVAAQAVPGTQHRVLDELAAVVGSVELRPGG